MKSYAQFVPSSPEEARKVSETKLAVVLQEKDEKKLKQLGKKPEELQQYLKGIEEFNQLLTEVLKQEWDISQELVFVSKEEAEYIKEQEDAKYFLLEAVERKNHKMGDFYSPKANSGFSSAHHQAYHFSSVNRSTMLSLSWAAEPKKQIAASYFPDVAVPSVSVTFMVQHLKNQLLDCSQNNICKLKHLKKEVEERTASLKEKTLLLYDPLISSGLQKQLDKGKIEKLYDHSYEVASSEKVEEIIKNNRDEYAYTIVAPAGAENHGKELYNYFIVDAKDGRILYFTGKSAVGANGQFHHAHLMLANSKID